MKNFFWRDKKNRSLDEITSYLQSIEKYAETNAVLNKKILSEIDSYYQKNKRKWIIEHDPIVEETANNYYRNLIAFSAFMAFIFFSSFTLSLNPTSQMTQRFRNILKREDLSEDERQRYQNTLSGGIANFSMLYLSIPFFLAFLVLAYQHKKELQQIAYNKKINLKISAWGDHFKCGVTQCLLKNSTLAMTSGHTYSYDELGEWLSQNKTDPETRVKLDFGDLIPNIPVDLIIHIVIDDTLETKTRDVWLKTLLQNPLGESGELLSEPMTYPDGFTCSLKDIEKLKGKNPITQAVLGTPIRNITLKNIIETFEKKIQPKEEINKKSKPQ